MSQDAGLIKGGELYLNISHCAMAHDCLVVCCGSCTASLQLPGAEIPTQKDSREFAYFGDLYAKQ